MQDARCQMQGARHTPCFCSSQLTAHGLEQQYNNPAKSLKTQYFTRHDQLNLAGDDHLPGLCNCHPKLPTVIYNCHLQLPSIGQLPSLPSRLPITLHDPLHLLPDMRSNKGTGVRVLVLLVHSSDRWSVKGNHFRHVQKQK